MADGYRLRDDLCAVADTGDGPGINSAAPHRRPGAANATLSVHDELRELNHATIFATCCSSRILCLFRARRLGAFAAVSRSTSTTFPLRRTSGNDVRPFACSRSSILSRCSSRLRRKISRSALIACLQRRGFRRQFPPQLEADLGQAAMGLGYRSEQVLSFVFGHVTQNCGYAPAELTQLTKGRTSSTF